MGNKIKINGVTFENLANHPVAIMSHGTIYEWDKNPKGKPELISEYRELNKYIETYRPIAIRIDNLPEKKKNTVYIVPLFIVNGIDELVREGRIRDRRDIVSPGKKVFGKGGTLLYAKGFRAR